MTSYPTNQDRTAEYLERFDRERTLKFLIPDANPLIFDVGANVGTSLDEFKTWWPDAHVHCFEPQQECWAELEKRTAKYPRGDTVVGRFAAGNETRNEATFYSHDVSSGTSGFHRVNLDSLDSIQLRKAAESAPTTLAEYERSFNHERTVQVVRLDEYMSASAIQRVHLLKIDTQGYEPEVLDGLGTRLSDVDVVVSELMFYDYYERSLSFTSIERFLLPSGFRLYDISHIAKNPMNGRTDWVDVIYIHDRVRHRQRGG